MPRSSATSSLTVRCRSNADHNLWATWHWQTTKLISIVKQELEDGTKPEDIAFVSFSRKAAEEARTRAASALGMNPDQMVWFNTLHSMAFQFLGIGTRQVLRGADFTQLGNILGLEFSSNSF